MIPTDALEMTIPELARVQDWLLRYVKEQDREDVRRLCHMATLGVIKMQSPLSETAKPYSSASVREGMLKAAEIAAGTFAPDEPATGCCDRAMDKVAAAIRAEAASLPAQAEGGKVLDALLICRLRCGYIENHCGLREARLEAKEMRRVIDSVLAPLPDGNEENKR